MITDYLERVGRESDGNRLAIVIPEFVVRRWWEHLLHNQTALILKGRLLFKENVIVISVPYHL